VASPNLGHRFLFEGFLNHSDCLWGVAVKVRIANRHVPTDVAAGRGSGAGLDFCESKLHEQPDGGLLDKQVFGVNMGLMLPS